MLYQGDIVVSVLTGKVGKIVERWSPATNPFYRDYRVMFDNGCWITRERHMRKAMFGERRLLHAAGK